MTAVYLFMLLLAMLVITPLRRLLVIPLHLAFLLLLAGLTQAQNQPLIDSLQRAATTQTDTTEGVDVSQTGLGIPGI